MEGQGGRERESGKDQVVRERENYSGLVRESLFQFEGITVKNDAIFDL